MKRGRYPYRRGCTRRWCRMCNAPRFVRLMMNRDAHLCLTCGAKTTGMQEVHILSYTNMVSWDGVHWYVDRKTA